MRRDLWEIYKLVVLQIAKWITTVFLLVSSVIVILALVDFFILESKLGYGWQPLMFGLIAVVLSVVIRNVIGAALNRVKAEH
jgi:hypothetical protein